VLSLQASQQDQQDIIYITEDTDTEEETEPAQPELHLNMHTMWGLKSHHHTFTVSPMIGTQSASALVDTGSTTTFMTPGFATRANCELLPTAKMNVTVANGQTLWTEFSCLGCTYTIQDTKFIFDFKILQLKGYDVILGADWIYHQSLDTLDYKK
jgi:hypothetical protein